MVTGVKNEPQLRFGEERLEDETLLMLLLERQKARERYDDVRADLETYLEEHVQPGEWRVGPFRVRLSPRTAISIMVPKK